MEVTTFALAERQPDGLQCAVDAQGEAVGTRHHTVVLELEGTFRGTGRKRRHEEGEEEKEAGFHGR